MADALAAATKAEAAPAAWEPRIVGLPLLLVLVHRARTRPAPRASSTPPNVDIIRVMCSGRIDPELVTAAFARGADGVMVCGCHIGDCHYIAGNHKTMARMPLVRRILVQLGIDHGGSSTSG